MISFHSCWIFHLCSFKIQLHWDLCFHCHFHPRACYTFTQLPSFLSRFLHSFLLFSYDVLSLLYLFHLCVLKDSLTLRPYQAPLSFKTAHTVIPLKIFPFSLWLLISPALSLFSHESISDSLSLQSELSKHTYSFSKLNLFSFSPALEFLFLTRTSPLVS